MPTLGGPSGLAFSGLNRRHSANLTGMSSGAHRTLSRPMEHIACNAVHPQGLVKLDLRFIGEKFSASVTLPKGITGELVWRRKRLELALGQSDFVC